MNVPKEIRELKVSIDETMRSIRAVKGENYEDIVEFLLMGVQLTKLVAFLCRELTEEQTNMIAKHTAGTLGRGSELLFRAYNFTEEQEQEVIDWVDQLSKRIDATAPRRDD